MTKTVAKIKLNNTWFYNTKDGFKCYHPERIYGIETMRVMWIACAPENRRIIWRA